MTLSDDDLLGFDMKRLGGFQTAPRALLQKHGDIYRSHLVMARWLDGYRERRAQPSPSAALHDSDSDSDFEAGVEDTLRDLAAHLRQGDFLPGGSLYEDEQERE